MTARAAALPVLVLAAVCIVVWRIMQTSIFWGIFTACAIAAALFLRACAVFIGGGRGAHAAPRRYVLDDDMPTAVIPRVATEHAPPWQPAPVPVIEPDAVMPAPVPEPVIEPYAVASGPFEPTPEALAIWVAAGTVSGDGQVRTMRVELLPPVEELLGYPTVDDWLESAYTRAMALQVRRLELTDGAP